MKRWIVSLAMLLVALPSEAQVRSGRFALRGQEVFRGIPQVTRPWIPQGPFYPNYPYYSVPYYSEPVYSAPDQSAAYDQINSLTDQVQWLTSEVQRLQSELAAERAKPPEPLVLEVKETTPPPETRTVLIFRDGRRLETHGYAIVDSTLWTTYEDGARKFPLSDLDLDATRKENLQRGINFLP